MCLGWLKTAGWRKWAPSYVGDALCSSCYSPTATGPRASVARGRASTHPGRRGPRKRPQRCPPSRADGTLTALPFLPHVRPLYVRHALRQQPQSDYIDAAVSRARYPRQCCLHSLLVACGWKCCGGLLHNFAHTLSGALDIVRFMLEDQLQSEDQTT